MAFLGMGTIFHLAPWRLVATRANPGHRPIARTGMLPSPWLPKHVSWHCGNQIFCGVYSWLTPISLVKCGNSGNCNSWCFLKNTHVNLTKPHHENWLVNLITEQWRQKPSTVIPLSVWIVGNSWKLIGRKSECGIQCLIVGDQIYEPWWISSGNCWAQFTLHGQFNMLFNMLVIKKAELFTESELIFLHCNLHSPWNLIVKLVVKLHHQTTGSYFIHKTLLLKTGYPACKYPEASHLISMGLIHKTIMFIHKQCWTTKISYYVLSISWVRDYHYQ